MASKSEKKYRQIKRTHIGISIFEFFLFSIISAIILIFAVAQFAFYVIDSKLTTEYGELARIAGLYDKARAENDESIYTVLENEDHDFIVTDSDGNIILEKGKNTCGNESWELFLTTQEKNVTVYSDLKRSSVYPGKNGRIKLDLLEMGNWFDPEADISKNTEKLAWTASLISLPLWMSIDVAGGDQKFIGKAIFSANRHDIIMITSFFAVIAVLIFIILITMLVTAVKNVIRQRSMISLFFKDIVTGGHNWTWFLVMSERALKKWRNSKYKFAVVSLLMVNYRNYCLCHSLSEGEKLLCKIYKQLCMSLDKTEMCAHATSSDFALMLKYNSEQELRARLEAIIKKLEATDEDHKFSFQAGVAFLDRALNKDKKPVSYKEIDIETEYNNASAARMALAGSDDSGVAFFDGKLKEEQEWLDIVQEKQQRALDNEEFMVYYQPKYDPKTDTLRGAEALIRWNSPEYGIIPPGKFIPIFEKNGFITMIDHYMIKHVAADQRRWLDKGYSCVPVSVNVSRAHFVENNLADQIKDMVDEAGTPHELIEIELTESAFFDDKKAMINTITKLKSYGFAVSMDDFGSGYSSLNSLKDMPLDVLKLDAEFFRGKSEDCRGEIVVSEAIRLGKLLNMRIVAEGVEVKEQVDFLAAEDCDMIQGYYYAKPMPKDEYEERMKQA